MTPLKTKLAPHVVVAIVSLIIGAAIAFPLRSHTVTKTKIKTVQVAPKITIKNGESAQRVVKALDPRPYGTSANKIANTTYQCVVYAGKLDSQHVPTDWYDTFCAATN